jgi:hypothetical protein
LIGQFIEEVYNRQRLHLALDYRPSAAFETGQSPTQALTHAAKPGSVTE